MRLAEYLAWSINQPWGWGVNPGLDCCKFVGKWVIVRGFVDPMVLVWRNPYDSEMSALRRIASGGGLVRLWREGLDHVGAAPVDEWDQLQAGDVGVIRRATSCGTDEAAGIWTGERWVTLGLRGLDFGPAEALAVWRV